MSVVCKKNLFSLFVMLFSLSACQTFQRGTRSEQTHSEGVKESLEKSSHEKLKMSHGLAQVRWIREVFPPHRERPYRFMNQNPVLVMRKSLVVQGHPDYGVKAYTVGKGKLQWTFKCQPLVSPVSLAGDLVVFASMDGFLYALNSQTGLPVWRHYMGDRSLQVSSAGYDEKLKLVFVAGERGLTAISAKSGSVVWSYFFPFTPAGKAQMKVSGLAKPLVVSSSVVFKKENGSVVALNKETGKRMWEKSFFNKGGERKFVSGYSSLKKGSYCIYSSDATFGVYCLEPATGSLKWKYPENSLSNVLFFNGVIYVSTLTGRIIALDSRYGKKIWDVAAGEGNTGLVPYKDHLVYGEFSGALKMISQSTGRLKGEFHFGSGMSRAPVVKNDELFFFSNVGWLYKLSLFPNRS